MICLNKKRVLHILSALDFGGVETMLYNYYKHMDSDNIIFDFIVYSQRVGKMEEHFKLLGSKIFHVTPKKESFIKNTFEIAKVINNGKYDVVHIHQGFSSFNAALLSKLNGVPTTIVHNHGVKTVSKIKKPFFDFLKFLNWHFADWHFACSDEAGKNLFGKKWSPNNKCFVMKNAIELEKYKFNANIRQKMRNELSLDDDSFLILHAGRMDNAKNQSFLLDVFEKISSKDNKSFLVLAGDGPLKQDLIKKAVGNGIENKVVFTGVLQNLNDWYQAADVFVFPSKHEGLGMVAIEAQISGLPVVCSTGVPRSVELTAQVSFLSLSDDLVLWQDKILSAKTILRTDNIDILKTNGYDVCEAAQKYQSWLLESGDLK